MNPEDRQSIAKTPLWRHPVAVLIVFSVIGFLLYARTLDYNFNFDSIGHILNKDRIHVSELSAGRLLAAVKSGRPVGDFTLALNWYFNQDRPAGYRIVNICIHILTGFFFFLFAFRTLQLADGDLKEEKAFLLACSAALIWLVHPVDTQSVTYVIQRYNSLAAMFFILSMLCYAKGRTSRRRLPWMIASAAAGLLSLGSKQNTAVLPFFLFLYEWFFFQQLDRAWLKKNVKYPLALLVAVFLLGWLYLGADPMAKLAKFRDYAEGQFTVTERFLTQFRVIVYYISLFFVPLPSRLSLDYDFPLSHSLVDPITTLLSLLLLLSLLGVAVFRAKRHRVLSFGILWFFGTLAIESSILPLAVIFEHRTYLPFTFLSLLTVMGIDRLVRSEKAVAAIVAAVSLTFGIWTFQRNHVWQNGLTLWSDVLKKAPGKARALSNVGTAIEKREGMAAAEPYYEEAVKKAPYQYEALNNLGRVRYRQGRYKEALALFDRAIEENPRHVKAMNNRGSTYLAMGKTAEAIAQFKAVLTLDPENEEAERNLGSAYLGIGKFEAAIAHLKRAVALDPDAAEARINLAGALMHTGQLEKARDQLLAALKTDPENPEAQNNLGTLLIQEGAFDRAEEHFGKALRTDPAFAPARENLERLLSMDKDPRAKADALKEKIKKDPENPVLYWQSGRLLAGAGRFKEAAAMFEKAVDKDRAFLPALDDAATIYAHIGDPARALEYLKRIVALDPTRADAYYNAACMYARLHQPEQAVSWLEKAVENGYRHWERIETDPDLDGIRATPGYRRLMENRKK